MKRLFLWIVMVLLMVALLLGGAGATLYAMTGENRLPDTHPTLGEVALEPNGSDWSVPVLGQYLTRSFGEPTNLTVQKLGDFGDAAPALVLPDWVSRSELTLTAPDGTVGVTGDAAGYNSYVYSQNGTYELQLTLYRDPDTESPGQSTGWYSYRANFTVNQKPRAILSTDSAPQGTIVAVWVTGILDGSTPTLATDLGDVWFRPTQDGYMGYIPVTYNAEGGAHTLTLSCGDLVQELTLSVTEMDSATIQTQPDSSSDAAAAEEYRNAIWPLYTTSEEGKLWQGAFASPHPSSATIPYGARLMAEGQSAGRSTGLTYGAAEPGSIVSAPQNGVVVFAGTLAMSGGTVVIDHGCGVKSYLFGMGEVQVQKGQNVVKGDTVGLATDAHDLIYELRIGSKSVDPSAAIRGSSGLQYQENR